MLFFFQAEDGIRDAQESRGLGDVYKRQLMKFGGDTRTITWSPDRTGAWVFHCHLASHVTTLPHVDRPEDMNYPDNHDHGDPDHHALTGMNGLVLGITVDGADKAQTTWRPAKQLRLFVQSD